MKLLDTIKNNFARGLFSKAMKISGLPSEYIAWTIKQEQWIGVAIPLPKILEFSEHFANVRLYTENNVAISDKEYNLLILRCDDLSLRNEFATICYHFIEPGEDGQNRQLLINNPEEWWNKWKSLLGNRDSEKEAYSIIGELLALEHLLKNGINAKWQGAKGGTQDIQTDKCNYEVKSTTARYGYEVTINSIYQLGKKGTDLKLIFCRFEKAAIGMDINAVIKSLVSLGYSELLLEKAMEANGLEKGCTARSKKYRIIEMKSYNVDDNFPVITELSFKDDVIPKNIIRINYTVNLSGLPCENLLETEQNL
ncbi:PD-(D/E)XK motif protein [Ruminococcus flavefaciens]|uniref:PD-(D/E)XK motif protein n=1 Tax=Ruminococcus flavefaciens TaxID=1265 RepID=UPI0002F18373|nr:PD-(D/E)XK motif protein [Ruminococcus flavefaciens]